MSEIIKKIYKKFIILITQPLTNPDENEAFQTLKNISLIFSYFYVFDSISLDFIKEYLNILIDRMDEGIIELLLVIIQNIGMKVRKDNPKILKDLIDFIKDSFEKYKTFNKVINLQKGDFLLMMLNDIKLNKNIKNNPFESLSYLMNWQKKNVIQRMRLIPKIFSFGFKNLENVDFEKNKWWILKDVHKDTEKVLIMIIFMFFL